MIDFIELLLKNDLSIAYKEDFDFSKNSTIGIGGKAKIVFYPTTIKELIALVDLLEENNAPYLVLGNLSNVLPPDQYLEKAIILTTKLTSIEFAKSVFVSAGVTSGALIRACAKNGKTGVEFLAGIPCTIGGATYMNAGAGGKYISDIVKRVLVYKQRRLCILTKKECEYGYKTSVFMKNGGIILGVELELDDALEEEILANQKNVLATRNWLPKGRSMGCVFKNPLGESAGKLIEGAGLKGLRNGGAVVSEIHANFIINEKNATQNEVLELIRIIKNAVFAQYKIILEEEIEIID